MNHHINRDWEIEFDKKFELRGVVGTNNPFNNPFGDMTWWTPEDVKDFVRSLLDSYKEEVREKIEKIDVAGFTYGGFRRQVLSALSQSNKGE